MNALNLTVTSFVLLGIASLVSACDHRSQARKAEQAQVNQPGWVSDEDAWIYPLRLDSVEELDAASDYYQRNEEQAAATSIEQAASWLEYAAGHAEPRTRAKLETARTELKSVAGDLAAGEVVDAGRMGGALARASAALAEWHFYRAKEQYGRNEARYASEDLQAAAAHLRRAAESAHYQFGPETIVLFDDIVDDHRIVEEGRAIDEDLLGERLDGIEKAVEEMANALT